MKYNKRIQYSQQNWNIFITYCCNTLRPQWIILRLKMFWKHI